MKLEAVFFDFDGVILDSVEVKTAAFAEMFKDYGEEIQAKVVAYHHAYGGISRYEKFKYYYNTLLGKPISQSEVEALGQEFSDIVLEKVLASAFIPGAKETLALLKKKQVPAFVISGTPEKELKLIVKERGLERYFAEVHGAPKTKAETVLEITARYKFNLPQAYFFGDAMTDFDAAQKAGVPFRGIVEDENDSPFPQGTAISTSVGLP